MTAPTPELALLISRLESAVDHRDMPAPTMNLLSEAAESLSALACERDQARQMLADAPHGDFCNQPDYPCRCWKASL